MRPKGPIPEFSAQLHLSRLRQHNTQSHRTKEIYHDVRHSQSTNQPISSLVSQLNLFHHVPLRETIRPTTTTPITTTPITKTPITTTPVITTATAKPIIITTTENLPLKEINTTSTPIVHVDLTDESTLSTLIVPVHVLDATTDGEAGNEHFANHQQNDGIHRASVERDTRSEFKGEMKAHHTKPIVDEADYLTHREIRGNIDANIDVDVDVDANVDANVDVRANPHSNGNPHTKAKWIENSSPYIQTHSPRLQMNSSRNVSPLQHAAAASEIKSSSNAFVDEMTRFIHELEPTDEVQHRSSQRKTSPQIIQRSIISTNTPREKERIIRDQSDSPSYQHGFAVRLSTGKEQTTLPPQSPSSLGQETNAAAISHQDIANADTQELKKMLQRLQSEIRGLLQSQQTSMAVLSSWDQEKRLQLLEEEKAKLKRLQSELYAHVDVCRLIESRLSTYIDSASSTELRRTHPQPTQRNQLAQTTPASTGSKISQIIKKHTEASKLSEAENAVFKPVTQWTRTRTPSPPNPRFIPYTPSIDSPRLRAYTPPKSSPRFSSTKSLSPRPDWNSSVRPSSEEKRKPAAPIPKPHKLSRAEKDRIVLERLLVKKGLMPPPTLPSPQDQILPMPPVNQETPRSTAHNSIPTTNPPLTPSSLSGEPKRFDSEFLSKIEEEIEILERALDKKTASSPGSRRMEKLLEERVLLKEVLDKKREGFDQNSTKQASEGSQK